MAHWQQHLQEGLAALQCEAPLAPLVSYLALLEKWNKAYNLTAVRALEEMVEKHILDSLAVAPFIKGDVIVDVGSGAGLPGIPLAILFPQRSFVLVESIGKKCRFLDMVKRTLALSNVCVVQARAETYKPVGGVDCVIARAVGSMAQLVQWTRPCLRAGGEWLFMKGHVPTEELAELQEAYQVHTYHVPGLAAARCVICVER